MPFYTIRFLLEFRHWLSYTGIVATFNNHSRRSLTPINDFRLRYIDLFFFSLSFFCPFPRFHISTRGGIAISPLISGDASREITNSRHGYGLPPPSIDNDNVAFTEFSIDFACLLEKPIVSNNRKRFDTGPRGIKPDRRTRTIFVYQRAELLCINVGLKSYDLPSPCPRLQGRARSRIFRSKMASRHFSASPFKSYKFSLARQCCFIDFVAGIPGCVVTNRFPPCLLVRHPLAPRFI